MSAGDEGRRVNMLHPDRLSATALLTRTMTARVAAAVAPLVQSHGRRQQVRGVARCCGGCCCCSSSETYLGPLCVSVGRCKLAVRFVFQKHSPALSLGLLCLPLRSSVPGLRRPGVLQALLDDAAAAVELAKAARPSPQAWRPHLEGPGAPARAHPRAIGGPSLQWIPQWEVLCSQVRRIPGSAPF
jgi:hypothetical protein